MTTPRENDEFERIQAEHDLERARRFVTQYEEGLAHYRRDIENPAVQTRYAGRAARRRSTMTTDPSNDPHIAVLQALLVADREALIARYQQWAESDAATGHMAGQRHWQERADELRATPFSWEKGKQAGERSSAA